jgi:hypothetical protein
MTKPDKMDELIAALGRMTKAMEDMMKMKHGMKDESDDKEAMDESDD